MNREVLAFPKPMRLQDRGYLRWIRQQPCLIDHVQADAHHVDVGGVGTKGSDYRTLPLCRRCHREAHTLGRRRFEERHRLDMREEIIRLLETYLSAQRSGEMG
jgi:hypothetical protein